MIFTRNYWMIPCTFIRSCDWIKYITVTWNSRMGLGNENWPSSESTIITCTCALIEIGHIWKTKCYHFPSVKWASTMELLSILTSISHYTICIFASFQVTAILLLLVVISITGTLVETFLMLVSFVSYILLVMSMSRYPSDFHQRRGLVGGTSARWLRGCWFDAGRNRNL